MMETLAAQAVAEFERFGAQAQESIASAMYNHVAARGQYSDLVAEMSAILGTGVDVRGNSMARYADLWANDGIMNFHQSVTLKKAGDAGLTTFLYYGNVIRTSRSFCIDRAGKVYSREQIESWDGISWRGKSGPPLTYRGGWNCRHHWHPIKKEWVPEGSIKTGDYYTERGIDVARGTTVPIWPGKGPAKPKAAADKPKDLAAPYTDPHHRWVPWENPTSKEAKDWIDDIYKQGEDFSEFTGMGPCAPVADNIVQVLNAQGRKARVMYTNYAPIGPAGEQSVSRMFGHYVAVELDEFDRVFRIYDPTNPYRKGIHDIVPGRALPKDYFPEGTWVRKRPQDVDRVVTVLESEDAPLISQMRKVVDTPAQHRIYYGRTDVLDDWTDLKAGAGYDIDDLDDVLIVRSVGELAPGASSRVLYDMADDALNADRAFVVHANDIPYGLYRGGSGASYLEDIGMVKDVRRGEGWYFAERDELRRVKNRINQDVEKAMPVVNGEVRETIIYPEGHFVKDEGDMYTLTEHEWWYGKLGKPGAFDVPEGGWQWAYMTTKKDAKAQLEDLAGIVDDTGGYQKIDTGMYTGHYRWRHHHAGDSRTLKRTSPAPDLDRELHGKAIIGRDMTLNSMNGLGTRFAEMQTRSQRLNIPVMRGLNSTPYVRDSIGGSMGDGVLTMNMKTLNRAFGNKDFDVPHYKGEVRRFIDDAEPVLAAIGKAEGKASANYKVLKAQIDGRKAELKKLDEGTWAAPTYGSDKRTPSKFVPDQEGVSIPYSTGSYLTTSIEQVYDVMEHEFGHHIHQQLFYRTASQFDMPPLEMWLQNQFRRLNIKGKNQRNIVSGYSTKNHREWFAENYAMWRQGRQAWVRPELRGLMEGLDELEAGKITEDALFNRLFTKGDLSTGQWLDYAVPVAKIKYVAPVINEVVDMDAKLLRYINDGKARGRAEADIANWMDNHGFDDAENDVANYILRYSTEGRIFLYNGRFYMKEQIFNKTGAIYMPKPGEAAVKYKPGG